MFTILFFIRCDPNWFGGNCTTFICEKSNPCLNRGKCNRVGEGNDFTCTCRVGYTGPLCDCKESKSLFLSVCLSVSFSLSLSLSVSVCLYLSLSISVCLSVCLSVSVSHSLSTFSFTSSHTTINKGSILLPIYKTIL